MANTKSAQKNIRKAEARAQANRVIISRVRTLAKKVKQATTASDKDAAKKIAAEYVSALDKAVKRGIIHQNKVARHKSEVATVLQK